MALSDAAETRPSLAQEFSNLMLQLTSYSKQGQAKVVWDLGAKHAGAVSVGAILPMAGSFRALYLSLRAKGVRVLLRSSLPMIWYDEREHWTICVSVYVNRDLFLTFILPWCMVAWSRWGCTTHVDNLRIWLICARKTKSPRGLYCCPSPGKEMDILWIICSGILHFDYFAFIFSYILCYTFKCHAVCKISYF